MIFRDSQQLNKEAQEAYNEGRLVDAKRLLHEAIQRDPKDITAYGNLGKIAKEEGNFSAGIAACEAILKLDPKDADIMEKLSSIYMEIGETEKSLALARNARERAPLDWRRHSDFLFFLNFGKFPEAAYFMEHRRFAEYFEKDGYIPMKPYPRRANGKIRIGYISPDLHQHAVKYILEPLLAYHDRSKFEVYCYSTGGIHDHATEKLKSLSDVWREVTHFPDEDIKRMITFDQIDILIDLAGHTGQNNLTLFALRAAPIQVSWFGYMQTSGLLNMDYRLTDLLRTPLGREKYYTEKLIRIPSSYTFAPAKDMPALTPLPMQRKGGVTFGTFNTSQKINKEVLAAWAQILKSAPDAKLLFMTPLGVEYKQLTLKRFQELGISREQLDFRDRTNLTQFLSYIGECDLALDTFPYTGGITTYHCLAMGVPVITLEGETEYERNTAAILREFGLDDFVSSSTDEYIQKALTWKNRAGELAALRASLREKLLRNVRTMIPEAEKAFIELYEKAIAQG